MIKCSYCRATKLQISSIPQSSDNDDEKVLDSMNSNAKPSSNTNQNLLSGDLVMKVVVKQTNHNYQDKNQRHSSNDKDTQKMMLLTRCDKRI